MTNRCGVAQVNNEMIIISMINNGQSTPAANSSDGMGKDEVLYDKICWFVLSF